MDAEMVRKDFPILNQQGRPLVYMDNGATAQKPEAVIDRISRYYGYENANIHRGSYPLSSSATRMFEDARETVRNWIGAEYPDEIVFTKGCTESVNLAASAVFETWVHEGDNVIVTELEHSSNYYPWKHHCGKNRAEFRVVETGTDGRMEADHVISRIDSRTKLVAVTAMSNVTGFRPDLEKIIKEAHRAGAIVLVDAAQGIVHQAISVGELGCDFLCFSSHKIYGPMGIGVLYGKRKYLEEMAPYLYGGDMVVRGDGGSISYKKDSGKYEAGTQDIGGVLGLEAALKYLDHRGFKELLDYEAGLGRYFRERMERIRGVHMIGYTQDSPIIAFESDRLGAYDIGVLLANDGIAIRCGAHCAYPLMKRMGKESICRISLAFYNTRQEIDYVADRLEYICGRRG